MSGSLAPAQILSKRLPEQDNKSTKWNARHLITAPDLLLTSHSKELSHDVTILYIHVTGHFSKLPSDYSVEHYKISAPLKIQI